MKILIFDLVPGYQDPLFWGSFGDKNNYGWAKPTKPMILKDMVSKIWSKFQVNIFKRTEVTVR